jgi:pyruvate, water dikinase
MEFDVEKEVREAKKINVKASDDYIKWLSELNKTSGPVAGGKGANLAEMYNSGFPVPPAFVVTSHAFDSFIKKAGLGEKIFGIINNTNVDNTEELEKNAAKVRKMIIDASMPKEIEDEITEAYEILSTDEEVRKAKEDHSIRGSALDILSNAQEPAFVAVRSSATTEDLASASFAGQQETFTNIKGDYDLLKSIQRCFASLYTARAVYYRKKKGFKEDEALVAVVIQKMIQSQKSGVMFTKNPMSKQDEVVIEAVFGLGEGIVSGKIWPDHYIVNPELEIKEIKLGTKKTAIVRDATGKEKEVALSEDKSKQQVLDRSTIISLANTALKIEEHYGKPQDIEFAIDAGEIYIVQSRPITTLHLEKQQGKVEGEVILTGLSASPGVSSGRVRVVNTMEDLKKVKEGDVLVTKMTNPDMVITMQKASAIVTDEGGATAHAAIVSREMGIPCVVGTDNATEVLKDGLLITVDGSNGKVHEGASGEIGKPMKKAVLPVFKDTKTKIKVIVDLPEFAQRAATTQITGVGLLRLEGIIASSGKHPLMFVQENNTQEYSKIIENGIEKISQHFKEVWIRASDIRSDEYMNLQGAPKEKEANPMLGFHGIRFSLKNPGILEAELSAIQRLAQKYPDKTFGIMFPQVINEDEIKQVYDLVHSKYNRQNIKVGAMIETPASVQIIREICKYVKFISFGTNDLTQYTLAVDRGNSDIQDLYNELHPAVLSQMKKVIQTCREYKIESSICGQAGSKPEMVKWLVEKGIDSISVNADAAHEISKLVKEIEARKPAQVHEQGQHSNHQGYIKKINPLEEHQKIVNSHHNPLNNHKDHQNNNDNRNNNRAPRQERQENKNEENRNNQQRRGSEREVNNNNPHHNQQIDNHNRGDRNNNQNKFQHRNPNQQRDHRPHHNHRNNNNNNKWKHNKQHNMNNENQNKNHGNNQQRRGSEREVNNNNPHHNQQIDNHNRGDRNNDSNNFHKKKKFGFRPWKNKNKN